MGKEAPSRTDEALAFAQLPWRPRLPSSQSNDVAVFSDFPRTLLCLHVGGWSIARA